MNVREAFEFELSEFNPKVSQGLTFRQTNLIGKEVYINVNACVYYDLKSNARVIAIYIPNAPDPLDLITYILQNPTPEAVVPISAVAFMGEVAPGNSIKKNLLAKTVFSKQVYIYSEAELSAKKLSILEEFSEFKGLNIEFRSSEYANKLNEKVRPLAFISHDSNDKDRIARPIAEDLRARGCPIWYDEYSLKVGDSLRESIENGIRDCHKCILVLSKNFFNNEGWTKAEFNSIFTKQIMEKKNIILPVWDNITPQEVYDYSPNLVDKFGLNWATGRGNVTARLYEKIMGKD